MQIEASLVESKSKPCPCQCGLIHLRGFTANCLKTYSLLFFFKKKNYKNSQDGCWGTSH
jgi:hypothetical protein